MLGEKIRELRKLHGITQRELSRAIGVSPSTVGMYEQGRREPDTKTLALLAQTLAVTPDTLLSDTPCELDELIDRLRGSLALSGDVMFNGQPLTEEDVEAVVNAMKIGIRIAMERRKNEK